MVDLSKYLTNKDVSISNDDFDIEKLQNDLYKGYTSNAEVDKKVKASTKDMVNKADYDKLQSDYASLETNYNSTIDTLNTTNSKLAEVSFNSKLAENHFNRKDYNEVREIRNSVYKDIKDDDEAIKNIAEKFKSTYFPEANKPIFTEAPNEAPLKANSEVKDIKITRNTSVKDLLIKK